MAGSLPTSISLKAALEQDGDLQAQGGEDDRPQPPQALG